MNKPHFTDRRRVLKTLGAGIVGGTVLTGTAVASCGADTCIKLQGHQFLPRNASVSLDSDNIATVKWTNKEPLINGMKVPHDVHLEDGDTHLVHSSDSGTKGGPKDEYLLPDDSYVVKFSEDSDGNLDITETRDDSSNSNETSAEIKDWGGNVELTMLCDIHDDFTNMVGTLTVTR